MQQLERPFEVALLLRHPRERRQGLRLALRKMAGATMALEALLGELADATACSQLAYEASTCPVMFCMPP